MLPVVVSFPPLFFWEPFPNVIFDIAEVSRFLEIEHMLGSL